MMHQPSQSHRARRQRSKRRALQKKKRSAVKNMKKRPNCAITRKTLREELQKSRAEWESHKDEHQPIVDEEDIANIVAKQTGIPVTRLTEGETEKVLKMEEALKTTNHRPRRCAQHRLQSDPPQPSRHQRSKPPHWRLPFPRAHRRRKNAPGPPSRHPYVWRRRRAHPSRHV